MKKAFFRCHSLSFTHLLLFCLKLRHAVKQVSSISSGHRMCSVKECVLKNFTNFTGRHLCWSLFLIKLQKVCNFIKKGLQYRCLPVKFAKFLRTPILKNICEQLLLKRTVWGVKTGMSFAISLWLIFQHTAINQKTIMMSLWYVTIKNGKHHLLKASTLYYIVMISKS